MWSLVTSLNVTYMSYQKKKVSQKKFVTNNHGDLRIYSKIWKKKTHTQNRKQLWHTVIYMSQNISYNNIFFMYDTK